MYNRSCTVELYAGDCEILLRFALSLTRAGTIQIHFALLCIQTITKHTWLALSIRMLNTTYTQLLI